jgi:kynureninase
MGGNVNFPFFFQKHLLSRGVFGHHYTPIPWVTGDECCLAGVEKLVGAESGEVALMNGLTVNLHVLLTAFYTPTQRRYKIVLESQAFPSDHYAIESQIRLKGFDPKDAMVCLKPREVGYTEGGFGEH